MILSPHSFGVKLGHCKVRGRALVPITSEQSAIASSKDEKIIAFLIISLAPAANEIDCESGFITGLTKQRLDKPMVFIALAADPILPVWDVSTKTILTLSK